MLVLIKIIVIVIVMTVWIQSRMKSWEHSVLGELQPLYEKREILESQTSE